MEAVQHEANSEMTALTVLPSFDLLALVFSVPVAQNNVWITDRNHTFLLYPKGRSHSTFLTMATDAFHVITTSTKSVSIFLISISFGKVYTVGTSQEFLVIRKPVIFLIWPFDLCTGRELAFHISPKMESFENECLFYNGQDKKFSQRICDHHLNIVNTTFSFRDIDWNLSWNSWAMKPVKWRAGFNYKTE